MKQGRMPKLVESLRSYTLNTFVSDLIAGLTVGLVALPLTMAFAISSKSCSFSWSIGSVCHLDRESLIMAPQTNVVVNVRSDSCDIICQDIIENEYIDIRCDEAYYQRLWKRLREDPILHEKLQDFDELPPAIIFHPTMEPPHFPMTYSSMVGSIVGTVVIYSVLAGIVYCVYVGAKVLVRWVHG